MCTVMYVYDVILRTLKRYPGRFIKQGVMVSKPVLLTHPSVNESPAFFRHPFVLVPTPDIGNIVYA